MSDAVLADSIDTTLASLLL